MSKLWQNHILTDFDKNALILKCIKIWTQNFPHMFINKYAISWCNFKTIQSLLLEIWHFEVSVAFFLGHPVVQQNRNIDHDRGYTFSYFKRRVTVSISPPDRVPRMGHTNRGPVQKICTGPSIWTNKMQNHIRKS